MRTLLVEGDKTFRIEIPDNAKVTYGPWAPPKKMISAEGTGWRDSDANKRGTLRIYDEDNKSIFACFAGVTSFRDISKVKYSELVAREEVSSIWKSDEKGYEQQGNSIKRKEWVDEPKLITGKSTGKKKK